MYRRILTCLAALLLLSGCASPSPSIPSTWDGTVSTYENEAFSLSYPTGFSLAREAAETWYFTAEGHTAAFSLTRENNLYGVCQAEEYADAAGIYDGVTVLSDTAFAVEKHIDNMLSGYFLYTVSEECVYVLEYNYGGSEEERALSALFAVTVHG